MVFENEAFDLPQVMWPDTAVARKHDRGCQPEFALTIGISDVDVRGLIALICVEVKSE